MTDNNDGTYEASYTILRGGYATVSVVLARIGGLYAEYFDNAFLSGTPSKTQIDNNLDFEWGQGLVTPNAGDFVSVHWFGKLLAPSTEDFTFLLSGDDGFRFYLNGVLLIDRWDTCCDDMTADVPLKQGSYYDFVVEYRELQEQANLQILWSSP